MKGRGEKGGRRAAAGAHGEERSRAVGGGVRGAGAPGGSLLPGVGWGARLGTVSPSAARWQPAGELGALPHAWSSPCGRAGSVPVIHAPCALFFFLLFFPKRAADAARAAHSVAGPWTPSAALPDFPQQHPQNPLLGCFAHFQLCCSPRGDSVPSASPARMLLRASASFPPAPGEFPVSVACPAGPSQPVYLAVCMAGDNWVLFASQLCFGYRPFAVPKSPPAAESGFELGTRSCTPCSCPRLLASAPLGAAGCEGRALLTGRWQEGGGSRGSRQPSLAPAPNPGTRPGSELQHQLSLLLTPRPCPALPAGRREAGPGN